METRDPAGVTLGLTDEGRMEVFNLGNPLNIGGVRYPFYVHRSIWHVKQTDYVLKYVSDNVYWGTF